MRALLTDITRLRLGWLLIALIAVSAILYLLDTRLRPLLVFYIGAWWPTAAEVWAAVVEIAIIFAVALVAIWLLRTVLDSSVVLEPVSVAEGLAKQGYSSEAVGRALLHEIRTIVRDAGTFGKTADFGSARGSDLDSIKLAATGLSLGTLVQLVASALGVSRQLVGGEVIETGAGSQAYVWTIRVAGRTTTTLPVALAANFDSMIRRAAESIVEAIDPYTAACYYEGVDRWADIDRALHACMSPQNGKQERWVHNLRALCARRRGRFTEAEHHCRAAIALDAEWPFPLINLGLIQHEQKNYENATVAFAEAELLDPRDADIQTHWGDSLYAVERYDDARHHYERALKLSPTNADAWCGMGVVALAEDDYWAANKHFNRALAFKPMDRAALDGAAYAREKLGDAGGVELIRARLAKLGAARPQLPSISAGASGAGNPTPYR